MVFMVGKLFLNEFVDANISNADHFSGKQVLQETQVSSLTGSNKSFAASSRNNCFRISKQVSDLITTINNKPICLTTAELLCSS